MHPLGFCFGCGHWNPKGLAFEFLVELRVGSCRAKLNLLGRAGCERDRAMAEWGTLTTVMVRQLPIKYTQGDLFSDLARSHKCCYPKTGA